MTKNAKECYTNNLSIKIEQVLCYLGVIVYIGSTVANSVHSPNAYLLQYIASKTSCNRTLSRFVYSDCTIRNTQRYSVLYSVDPRHFMYMDSNLNVVFEESGSWMKILKVKKNLTFSIAYVGG